MVRVMPSAGYPERTKIPKSFMQRMINNRRRPAVSPGISTRMVLRTLGLIGTITFSWFGQAVIAQSSVTPASSEAVQSLQTKLSGQWQAKYTPSEQVLTFIFTPQGKLLIQLPSDSEKATAQELGYRINPTLQPMQLDVLFTGTDQSVKTIFEFTPTGQLRLQLAGTNPGDPRPTAFRSDASLFEKVSDATTLPPNVQVNDVQTVINQERLAEAKKYTGTMNLAQRAYYLENKKFAKEISELGLGIKAETENYRYQIIAQKDSNRSVMITATAKRPELKSYTGAVFVVKNNNEELTISGVCETAKPSSTPPTMPQALSNTQEKIQCPTGSNQVGR